MRRERTTKVTFVGGQPARKLTAPYHAHELADMAQLKQMALAAPDGSPTRHVVLNEIMVIHTLKALLGAEVVS